MIKSDEMLLSRFQENQDAEAYMEIVDRYVGFVFAVAKRILQNRQLAEIASQDAFLSFCKNADAVTDTLPGWLHRATTRKSIALAEKKGRKINYAATEVRRIKEWKELAPFVDLAIDDLWNAYRQVVILHYIKGASHMDLMEEMLMPNAAVARQIAAGLEQLRSTLMARGVLVSVPDLCVLMDQAGATFAPPSLFSTIGKFSMLFCNVRLTPQ